jgi:transcriptional regulator with XRE-family HTH domain
MKPLHATRPEIVAKRLKLTREALGYANQKDFYAPLRIGPSAYSMWESGRQFPSIVNAARLCQEYGLTLDWLFRGDLSTLPHKTAIAIRARLQNEPSSDDETTDFIIGEITG